ncbi:septum formation family protein [Microbacteriaceae bacterium VKM Ac-2855]|nr:septum formation family protein [Microbacteriaceae bacterium VKM Ac-2855]
MRRVRSVLLAGVVGACAVALSACAATGTAPAPVRDTAGAVVESGDSDVFSLRGGDCLLEPDVDSVTDVTVVPCDEPYDLQIFSTFEQPGTDFTSDATLRAQALAGCGPAFATAIGISYSDSVLEYRTFVPSEISWAHGDRTIYCAAFDPAGPVDTPLLGSAR